MSRLSFYGDFVVQHVSNLEIDGLLGQKIHSSDFNIINFETPIRLSNTPSLKSGPSILQDINAPIWLNQLAFNVFILVNNHWMDYGEKAARETKATLGDDKCVGIGVGNEAYKPLLFGKKASRLPSWLWQNYNLAWFMILSLKLTIMVVLGLIIRV